MDPAMLSGTADVVPPTQASAPYARIAQLAQRLLGCEAAVLSVGRPSERGSLRSSRFGASLDDVTHCSCIAVREGIVIAPTTKLNPHLLAHPVGAREAGMRFFAALTVCDRAGHPIGTLAAMDRQERSLAAHEIKTLRLMTGIAADLYES